MSVTLSLYGSLRSVGYPVPVFLDLGIPSHMVKKHRYRVPNRLSHMVKKPWYKTCQYGHSSNQSLAVHTGSATGSDHSLDAPVVYKVSSNVHDHVGQIKGPGVRNQVVSELSWDASGALSCVASLYATNTTVQSVAVLHTELCLIIAGCVTSSKIVMRNTNWHPVA
eukprot:2901994-Pleurochrysis_carterae.AAC.4